MSGISGTSTGFYPLPSIYPTETFIPTVVDPVASPIEEEGQVEGDAHTLPSPSLGLVEAFEMQNALLNPTTGNEKTLFRFYHNRSLAILTSWPSASSASIESASLTSNSSRFNSPDDTTTTVEIVQTNSTFISSDIEVELLPISSNDAYIHDVVLDVDTTLFFLALNNRIASSASLSAVTPTSTDTQNVVQSLIYVTIEVGSFFLSCIVCICTQTLSSIYISTAHYATYS